MNFVSGIVFWFLSAVFTVHTAWAGVSESESALVVPLAYAEARGGLEWAEATRSQFLHDSINLWPLNEAEVRERGGSGPLNWLPASAQCHYISRFVAVVDRYKLAVDPDEYKASVTLRQRCYTQFQ